MPLSTALKGMNSQRVMRAISRASVVLPTPGGPQRMMEVELVALDLAAQRLAGAEDVLLADVILQPLGAHALGQRAFGVRRFGGGAGLASNRLKRAPPFAAALRRAESRRPPRR